MAHLNKDRWWCIGLAAIFSRRYVWLWYLDTYWLGIKETASKEKYCPNLSSGNQLPQVNVEVDSQNGCASLEFLHK